MWVALKILGRWMVGLMGRNSLEETSVIVQEELVLNL
jgi:hypothetical protein